MCYKSGTAPLTEAAALAELKAIAGKNQLLKSFIGQGYFIRGQLLDPETVQTELGVIRGNRAYTWPAGSSVDVLLRPDDIVYKPDSPLRALIVGKTFLGASTLYRLQLPTGNQLVAIFTSHADYPTGQEVGIAIAADHAQFALPEPRVGLAALGGGAVLFFGGDFGAGAGDFFVRGQQAVEYAAQLRRHLDVQRSQ